ncbi:MAG: hypothetical protein R3F04_15175 [Lysobacteraceae bacterium]
MQTKYFNRASEQHEHVVASQFLSVIERLQAVGDTVVSRVTEQRPVIEEWEQFPESEQEDLQTGYRYYYHSHACPGSLGEHGHFHLFKRVADGDEPEAFTHLLAIGVSHTGFPVRFFCTNTWVTGETTVSSKVATQLTHEFIVQRDEKMVLVAEWISKALMLFTVEVTQLFALRDRRRATLAARRQGFENDRRTTRIAEVRVDVMQKINEIESGNRGVH